MFEGENKNQEWYKKFYHEKWKVVLKQIKFKKEYSELLKFREKAKSSAKYKARTAPKYYNIPTLFI